MNRPLRSACLSLAVILLAISSDSACAQGTGQRPLRPPVYRRPNVSPYMNLFRPTFGPLPNYQTFVQPELEIRRGIEQNSRNNYRQEQAIRANSSQIQAIESGQTALPTIRATGHGAGFMTHGGRFNTHGGSR